MATSESRFLAIVPSLCGQAQEIVLRSGRQTDVTGGGDAVGGEKASPSVLDAPPHAVEPPPVAE